MPLLTGEELVASLTATDLQEVNAGESIAKPLEVEENMHYEAYESAQEVEPYDESGSHPDHPSDLNCALPWPPPTAESVGEDKVARDCLVDWRLAREDVPIVVYPRRRMTEVTFSDPHWCDQRVSSLIPPLSLFSVYNIAQ